MEATPGNDQAVDRKRIVAYYEARAATYDARAKAATDQTRLVERELLSRVTGWAASAVRATKRFALETGCGTGRITEALLKLDVPVIGVDLVQGMVRRASERLRQPPAAMFARASADALPFRDRTFGVVVDVGGFHHYDDPERVVKEWARVLGPGGRLVFADTLEKDDDEAGFLTAMERAARPGTVNVFYKPYEIEYFLDEGGFAIENASYYRVPRTFRRIDEDECGPAGADPAAYRAIVAGASPEMRESYEIGEEGLACRYLALLARKR